MIQILRIAYLSGSLVRNTKIVVAILATIFSIGEAIINFAPPLPEMVSSAQNALSPNATATAAPTATATAIASTATVMQATATAISTPPPQATAVPPGWDFYEPNDSLDTATDITVSQTLSGLTLSPSGDVDYFRIYGKSGQILNVVTFTTAGTDTFLRLYSEGGTLLAENDDKSATDLGSAILWTPDEDGWFFASVESAVPTYEGTYDLSILLESPTPTPTNQPTNQPPPPQPADPTATPVPPLVEADQYEPNNSVDGAAEIIIGTAYQGTLPSGDVDYYKLLTKSSNRYECGTSADGVDTAISVFGPTLEMLAENDDRAANDLSSSVTWLSRGEDIAYIAVQNRAGYGSYTLICEVPAPPDPPSNGGGGSNPAPAPTSTPLPPVFTPTPSIYVRYLGLAQETPEPVVETTVRLVVVYDTNGNRKADIGEGIKNISVRALYGGRIVAWGLTDERGEVTLSILGDVDRITIPYFNFWETRVRPGDDIGPLNVIVPAVTLPVILPVETRIPVEN